MWSGEGITFVENYLLVEHIFEFLWLMPIKTFISHYCNFAPIWSGLVWEILRKMGKLYFGPANPPHLPLQPCLSKSFWPGILKVEILFFLRTTSYLGNVRQVL